MPRKGGILVTVTDATTATRARQIRITPAAYEHLQTLVTELGISPRAAASTLLSGYCSRRDYAAALARPATSTATTDAPARQIRITPAAYERLQALVAELGISSRAAASALLSAYSTRKAYVGALTREGAPA